MAHSHGGCCGHDHHHDHDHEMKILNRDNLDEPAEANIDLDAMHPEIQLPEGEKWPLTEEELRDDFVMLTEDGGIKKKILKESTEKQAGSPPKNSRVTCHYTGTLPQNKNEKFDSSRDRNEPFEFKIGCSQVIKGWDVGIASMRKGELCILRCASAYAYGANGSPPKIPGGATLDFDVELIDFDSWQECEGAQGEITKNVMIDNDFGESVEENGCCCIKYRIYWIENGVEQILCERSESSITVDDDDRYCDAFHLAIKSMKCGEKSAFKIINRKLLNVADIYVSEEEIKINEFNHNKHVSPADQYTYFEIFVVSQQKAAEKWNATNEERIAQGTKYKTDGNQLFSMQRYLGAIKKYENALSWIDVDFSDASLGAQKEELLVSINNNLSLIYIKKKDWTQAIAHATKVLDRDANNVKGLMRRAQANLNDGVLEASKKDLKKALSLDKNNSFCKKLLKICNIRHKEYIQKQQKLYAGMFSANKTAKKKKSKKKQAAANDASAEDVTLEIDHNQATEV